MPGDVTRNYRIRYGVVDTASIPIGKLGAAVTALEVGTLSLAASMRQLDLGLQNAAEGAIQLDGAARSLTTALGQLSPKLSALSGTLRRVDTNAREAARRWGPCPARPPASGSCNRPSSGPNARCTGWP